MAEALTDWLSDTPQANNHKSSCHDDFYDLIPALTLGAPNKKSHMSKNNLGT